MAVSAKRAVCPNEHSDATPTHWENTIARFQIAETRSSRCSAVAVVFVAASPSCCPDRLPRTTTTCPAHLRQRLSSLHVARPLLRKTCIPALLEPALRSLVVLRTTVNPATERQMTSRDDKDSNGIPTGRAVGAGWSGMRDQGHTPAEEFATPNSANWYRSYQCRGHDLVTGGGFDVAVSLRVPEVAMSNDLILQAITGIYVACNAVRYCLTCRRSWRLRGTNSAPMLSRW